MTNIVTNYIQRIIGVASFKREKIWKWKVGVIGLIEIYRVGSDADKNHKYMFVTVNNDIKQIKYH